MAALASLNAVYTDSEGEEEVNEENDENSGTVTIMTPSASPSDKQSSNSSRPSSPVAPPPSRVSRKGPIVSYRLDDTVASDEEGEADDSELLNDGVLIENGTSKNESQDSADQDGVLIPPEPPGQCSMELQDKITKLYEKMQNQQLDMNAVIQKRKDFRNPSIYDKLIQYCQIDELGTNYPAKVYDAVKWNKESYYEELAKVQKVEMEKREKERKARVEFMSGSKKQDEDSKKRKSKWDQPGGNPLGSQNIKPAGLVQPSLTSSATGTKGTVISAFGSLPKKPRA